MESKWLVSDFLEDLDVYILNAKRLNTDLANRRK
jgi:hypothetical protein